MKTARLEYYGRLIGLATDGVMSLVHYGDLCSILPSSWRDALPVDKRIKIRGQVYANPTHLSQLAHSDAVDAAARKSLSEFLYQMPYLVGEMQK